ncbi:MAG: heptaprenyl diphosphate synthase [Myxococcota bacterium]|jgi:heptaprenyl diphosphate synthase
MRSISEQPAFLAEVDHRISAALSWDREATWSDLPTMAAAARHLCLAPGAKRARPRMVHLFGLAVGADPDGLADVSVAAELIHGASLMHDDVIDEGTMRRGRPTVNARWDSLTAVLAGDMLLSEAIYGLRRWQRPITEEALRLVADMSRAAMLEAHVRGKTDILPSQWRYIALGKTGAMFNWCGRAAAHLAGDNEALQRFTEFGDRFGVAFQMADDLKDLLGGDIGKDRYADIRNANPSYPLSIAMQGSPAVRAAFARAWAADGPLHPEQIETLGQLVIDTGALAQTHRDLGEEIAAAVDALGAYRERPGCAEMAAWAMMMWRSFAMEEAV